MCVIQNGTNVSCWPVDHPGYPLLVSKLSRVKSALSLNTVLPHVISFCIILVVLLIGGVP